MEIIAPVHVTRARVRDPYPRTVGARWLVRLGLSVPFLLVAWIISTYTPWMQEGVNGTLLQHVERIDWSMVDGKWVNEMYPPAGIVLLTILPHSVQFLGYLGAAFAGVFLQLIISVLHDKKWSRRNMWLMVLAIGGHPAFAYLATTNLLGFISLASFGLGMVEIYRFIARRNTDAGFRGSVWLLVCLLFSSSGLLLVSIALFTALFLTVARRDEPGARLANLLVVFYPSLAAAVAIIILQTMYLRTPLAPFPLGMAENQPGWGVLLGLFTTTTGLTTVFIALLGSIAGFLNGTFRGAILALPTVAALWIGRAFGVVPVDGVGYVLMACSMVTLAILPQLEARSRRTGITILLIALICAGWVYTLTSVPLVHEFLSFLTRFGVAS